MQLPDSADRIIEIFDLEPLPGEGGWFRRIYRCVTRISLPERFEGERALGSAIYYLIRRNQPSLIHRLPQEELYCFLGGAPAHFTLLDPESSGRRVMIGNPPHLALNIPPGTWQGVEVAEGEACDFSFFAISVFPEFDYPDREMGKRAPLSAQFPDFEKTITRLTLS